MKQRRVQSAKRKEEEKYCIRMDGFREERSEG
jgi:hypothetical protein